MDNNFDKISINDIVPSTYNPRKISNTEYNKLSRSISEFGVISPIIINLRNNHIIGGHQRFDVLFDEYISSGEFEELNLIKVGDIGWAFPSTDLKIDNLSQEKAMNIALNKISGEWDVPKLETLLIDDHCICLSDENYTYFVYKRSAIDENIEYPEDYYVDRVENEKVHFK